MDTKAFVAAIHAEIAKRLLAEGKTAAGAELSSRPERLKKPMR